MMDALLKGKAVSRLINIGLFLMLWGLLSNVTKKKVSKERPLVTRAIS